MTRTFAQYPTGLYRKRLARLHRALGIPADYAASRGLPLFVEARRLVSVGEDIYRRNQRLIPAAAAAWREMSAAAARDGVQLQLVSAFRPVSYQCELLRRKLERGLPLRQILRVSAAPGYSEHHSGRAVDLTAPGYPVLEEAFEDSDAFAWLSRLAPRFGFRMTYPRDNAAGMAYEPWHWAWWGDGPEGPG